MLSTLKSYCTTGFLQQRSAHIRISSEIYEQKQFFYEQITGQKDFFFSLE